MGNVGDNVTSSSRLFHVLAAATLNVLLPIVDSLNNGKATKRSVHYDNNNNNNNNTLLMTRHMTVK